MVKKGKGAEIVIILLLTLLFGLFQYIGLFGSLDNLVYDTALARERTPSDKIVIVGIDERSINEIGMFPWSRLYFADAVGKLTEAGAAAIGINVLFDVRNTDDEDGDIKLAEAASDTDRLTVAAMAIFPETSREEVEAEYYILPFEDLADITNTGFINVVRDSSDGVLRKALTTFKFGDTNPNSLPFEVYKTYCRVTGTKENSPPLDEFGQFYVNYAVKTGGYTEFSFYGLLNDEYNPALFKDKIVLIGPFARGIEAESLIIPLDKSASVYGAELNANIIQNMLEGNFKTEAPLWYELIAIAFTGLLWLVVYRRLKPAVSGIVTVVTAAAALAGVICAYHFADIIFEVAALVVFLIVCYITHIAAGIYLAQSEKRHIQGMFGRFVAPQVVKELVAGGIEAQLGGAEKELTILFVDIRGFTAFSEKNPPNKVVQIINGYLELTSHAIHQNSGTIDKFIGDATMAIFGAPNDLPDHALCAVKAAWTMKMNSAKLRELILREYGVDLQFGIGINTGVAVVGNMGSESRMDYTVIGDTVNTAARLESNAGKGQILISDATYQLVKDHIEVTDLGEIHVKNKEQGIHVYSVEKVN